MRGGSDWSFCFFLRNAGKNKKHTRTQKGMHSTLLTKIFVLSTVFSWICFTVSELGFTGVPVMSNIGQFLHEYWFADYSFKRKLNLGPHASDGPPMITAKAQGGENNLLWPFPDAKGASSSTTVETFTYDDSAKVSSEYTPVNGYGGVTNVQQTDDPYSTLSYYPSAVEPNDYIAKRLLGDQATSYSALKALGAIGQQIYNKKTFPQGTPFKTAVIGPNRQDSADWQNLPSYQSPFLGWSLLIPLTVNGAPQKITNPQIAYNTDTRDYSGNEYDFEGPGGVSGNEQDNFSSSANRPSWYMQTQNGELMIPQYFTPTMGVYPGEAQFIVSDNSEPYSADQPVQMPFPEFTTPPDASTNNITTTVPPIGWGENFTGNWGSVSVPSPSEQQRAYISAQLAQPNPIPII